MLLTQHTHDTLRKRENIQSKTAITDQVEINFASFAQEYSVTPTDILGYHSWRKAASPIYKITLHCPGKFHDKELSSLSLLEL